jgi:hypothetical protein
LITLARDFPMVLPTVVEGWDSIPEEYRERLLAAGSEGAELLAAAATGDEGAVQELRILRARITLWSWAGAEAARRAMVEAWKAWLSEAASVVGELALEVVEAGAKALLTAGLSELGDMLD